MSEIRVEYLPLGGLKKASKNPKKHRDQDIQTSIGRFGYVEPIVLDERTGKLVAGHGRSQALADLKASGADAPSGIKAEAGDWLVPVVRGWSSRSDQEADAYLLASNQLTIGGGWDNGPLGEMLRELEAADALDGTGFAEADLDALLAAAAPGDEQADGNGAPGQALGGLSEKFLVPPFSVLDARQGYWQDRKRRWLALGIQSEEGRKDNLIGYSESVQAQVGGTSIFDPVLCELAYRWFAPKGGTVIDPFAGGSVRGIVASRLGLRYLGCDLRQEQVDANRKQALDICKDDPLPPIWESGNSLNIARTFKDVEADFIFSCPPYLDLEVYSDNPEDLSCLDDEAFERDYRKIIAEAVSLLKPNRFACFVVGEVREKKGSGFYRRFVEMTIEAFEKAGARYYNEAVLVTSVGTLAMRVNRMFIEQRKLGKSHQNVLVFLKGDSKKMAAELGPVAVPEELFEEKPASSEFGEEMA